MNANNTKKVKSLLTTREFDTAVNNVMQKNYAEIKKNLFDLTLNSMSKIDRVISDEVKKNTRTSTGGNKARKVVIRRHKCLNCGRDISTINNLCVYCLSAMEQKSIGKTAG